MRALSTTTEIIAALGGAPKLAQTLGIAVKTVYHWNRAGETIPAKYRDVMAAMLFEVRCTAPASLWGMVEPKTDVEAV